MECLPIKPITHIAGNACRLLWQHFFTVRMTTDAHRGNSECGAAVENYTREGDRDVDKENQGAIVASPFPGGNTNGKQRPALRTPSACITVAFVVNASGSVAHETTGQQPSSARRRLQFRESFFAGDTGPPPTTKTRTMADPFGFFFEAVLVARRRWGKKKEEFGSSWPLLMACPRKQRRRRPGLTAVGGLTCGVFCCWLAVVVRREQNGAEQADKGRWLVFLLTILY